MKTSIKNHNVPVRKNQRTETASLAKGEQKGRNLKVCTRGSDPGSHYPKGRGMIEGGVPWRTGYKRKNKT